MGDAWLGIDLGTSSVKCLVLDMSGAVLAVTQERYLISRTQAGWAEQDPEIWWQSTCRAISSVLLAIPATSTISAIGLSGQMHGLVLVDSAHCPVRPAIIWSDGRADDAVARWRDVIDDNHTESIAGFRPASGMAGISLSWIGAHEPQSLRRASFAMQPKDFIRLRLTGEVNVEMTDAGASLLFDLDNARVSAELVDAAGVDSSLIPTLIGTLDVAGIVSRRAAGATGLPVGAPVAAGGGDQAMAALALGLDGPDLAAVSLSSGGTVVVPTTPSSPKMPGYHRLASAKPGKMFAMGVVLAAGLAVDWLAGLTGRSAASLLEQAGSARTDSRLISVADLGGTRTPRPESAAQGAFAGLGFHHGPEHLMRALVEGVAIGLTDALKGIQGGTDCAANIVLSGGGARFSVWRQAVADAAGVPVRISADLEHSAIGAACAGAMAVGAELEFDPRSRVHTTVYPDPESRDRLHIARERRAMLALASGADSWSASEGNKYE